MACQKHMNDITGSDDEPDPVSPTESEVEQTILNNYANANATAKRDSVKLKENMKLTNVVQSSMNYEKKRAMRQEKLEQLLARAKEQERVLIAHKVREDLKAKRQQLYDEKLRKEVEEKVRERLEGMRLAQQPVITEEMVRPKRHPPIRRKPATYVVTDSDANEKSDSEVHIAEKVASAVAKGMAKYVIKAPPKYGFQGEGYNSSEVERRAEKKAEEKVQEKVRAKQKEQVQFDQETRQTLVDIAKQRRLAQIMGV